MINVLKGVIGCNKCFIMWGWCVGFNYSLKIENYDYFPKNFC